MDLLPKIWQNRAGIAEGIKNKVFKKQHIEELAAFRADICRKCIWYSENQRGKEVLPEIITMLKGENIKEKINSRPDNHCIYCSCNTGLKTRCLACKCPIIPPKWEAVVADDEQIAIKEIISKNEEK